VVEIARKGMFKERPQPPHNSHPCELARNGFIQEIKKCNLQGTVFAGNKFAISRGKLYTLSRISYIFSTV